MHVVRNLFTKLNKNVMCSKSKCLLLFVKSRDLVVKARNLGSCKAVTVQYSSYDYDLFQQLITFALVLFFYTTEICEKKGYESA